MRVRNRVPAAHSRRPVRSLPVSADNEDLPILTTSSTTARSLFPSSRNTSAHSQRRLELYTKYRMTTTARPIKPIKKFQSKVLLDRRANATKSYQQRYPAYSSTTTAYPVDVIGIPVLQESSSASSSTRVSLPRTKIGGFLPNRLGSPSKQSGVNNKYLSQFDSDSVDSEENSSSQIQKPEAAEVIAGQEEPEEEPTTAAQTTYPTFELSGKPVTLPPALPIEELIKKFTGSEPISVAPAVVVTPSPVPDTSSIPELQSLEDLEESLKKLLAASSSNITSSSPSLTSSSAVSPTLLTSPPALVVATSPAQNTSPSFLPDTEKTSSSTLDSLESSTEAPEPTTYKPESTQQQQSVQRGPLDVSSTSFGGGSGGDAGGTNGNLFAAGFGPHQGGGGFQQQGDFQSQQSPAFNFQQHGGGNFGPASGGFSDPSFGAAGGSAGLGNFGGSAQGNPYLFGNGLFPGSSGQQGQFGGFDGLLHYSPTGPPAGDSNAITQGLSLLASFGGPGGGLPQLQQFQPSSGGDFQSHHQQQQHQPVDFQQQFFGGLSPQSFQPQSANFQPSFQQQQFNTPTSYPSFGFAQQQPQQFQSFQQQPGSFQQQPGSFQQQPGGSFQPQQGSFQPPFQPSPQQFSVQLPQQFQQQVPQQHGGGAFFQQQLPQSSPSPAGQPQQQLQFPGINPAQFGTLLNGPHHQSSVPGVGTASVSSPSSSSSSDSTSRGGGDKTERSGSASQLVEILWAPPKTSSAVVAPPPAADDESAQMIAIGTPPSVQSRESNEVPISSKRIAKKSLYARGLHSGYYDN